jgi:hypothetical protein
VLVADPCEQVVQSAAVEFGKLVDKVEVAEQPVLVVFPHHCSDLFDVRLYVC